jgi:hypothetical protein
VPTPSDEFEAPRNGEAVVLVDGEPVTPTIVINNGSARITVPGSVSLTMWAQSIEGEKTSVEDGSELVVEQGSNIVLSGTGFLPASPTKAWFFNSETVLGTGLASETGEVSETYSVARSANLGDQAFKFSGTTADGSTITVAVGLTVIAPDQNSPDSNTPSEEVTPQRFTVFGVLAISVIMFLLYLAFVMRRRKQLQD